MTNGPFEMRHEEGGYVEFLNEDVPTVVREIDGRVAILTTLEQPRKVVGYRVYDPGSSPSEVFGSASPAGVGVETPPPQTHLRASLFDGSAPMADGGEAPMTSAEEVLAWLLIEKIGVPDDVIYSPDQAQEIIVRNLDQAAKQLVDGGELLLQAESVIADRTKLLQAAKEVIACASDTYKKRNGHLASFEDDSGEKCWIVPFDPFEGLRSAVAALATTEGQS